MPWLSSTELASLRSTLARAQGELAQLRSSLAWNQQLLVAAHNDLAQTQKDLRGERSAKDKMILSLTDRKLQSGGQSPITDKPKREPTQRKLTAIEEAERASWYADFDGQFNHVQVNQMYEEYRQTGQLPQVRDEETIG